MTTTANIPADGEPPFYAGTTHPIWGVITQAGSPMDISDASIVWILAADADTTPLLIKTTDDDTQIALTDPTGGVFVIYLNPDDTETLGGQVLYHEARAAVGETQEVVFAGTVTITASDTVGLL
jgi:hypothetical protein